MDIDADMARDYDFPKRAFTQSTNKTTFHPKTNGLHEPLPDIYLKVPTGGGKTLLACHSIDLIQKSFLKKQTGLVLWIVPSTQIYRQTILALKDREHPYRQILDIQQRRQNIDKRENRNVQPFGCGRKLNGADVDASICQQAKQRNIKSIP